MLVTMVIPTFVLAKQIQPVTFVKQSKETCNPELKQTVFTPLGVTDFDPLVENITVTVAIKEIRALKTIDILSDPDFYVKVKINDNEFISDVWQNMKYVENSNWTASSEVPKDKEFVNITIELWDKNNGIDHLCDISPDSGNFAQARTAELTYSIATGIWWGRGDSLDDDNYLGDDYLGDPSGYGRLNGCDDNSIYQADRDCELWFNITQNDFDGDGLPYWLEVNMYNTSPLINNRGEDADGDGVPIEWEYRYGLTYQEWGHDEGYYMVYSPLVWENHSAFDDDEDGLNNIEEYKTSQWGSDPFRKDIFVELDQMAAGPNGEKASLFPEMGEDLLRDAFDRQNIFFHLDDGEMGGGEIIPFDIETPREELVLLYQDYFLHGDNNNWRKGVFHYGLLVYDATYAGYFVNTDDNYWGAFQISSCRVDTHVYITRANSYASVYMHELGHTLDIRIPGGHDTDSYYPWQINWWKYRPYKSCMNYGYTYKLVDYSDGSRGKNDHDDWGTLDLPAFQINVE